MKQQAELGKILKKGTEALSLSLFFSSLISSLLFLIPYTPPSLFFFSLSCFLGSKSGTLGTAPLDEKNKGPRLS